MKKIIVGFLGILLIGILAGYGLSWLMQQPQEATEEVRVAITRDVPTQGVQLYFVAPEGTYLLSETREIPLCEDDSRCIRSLLDGLIAGSQLGGGDVLPKQTKILGVDIENDLVRINFSRQLVDFHPGGSLSELLTVYSLINTLNENFSYLRQLQILIAGEVRQTLKGHVRIDQPVYADYSFSQPPLDFVAVTEEGAEQGLSIEKILEQAAPGDKN